MNPHKKIISLLNRFKETADDDQSYDIGNDECRALALLGYLKRPFKNRLFYEMTQQGLSAISNKKEWRKIDNLSPIGKDCLIYSKSLGVSYGQLFRVSEAGASPDSPKGSIRGMLYKSDSWGSGVCNPSHWMLPEEPESHES